jgi:hypothetical protein
MPQAYRSRSLTLLVLGILLAIPVSSSGLERNDRRSEFDVASLPWKPVAEQVKPDQMPCSKIRLDGPPTDVPPSNGLAYRAVADGSTVAFEVDGVLPSQRTMIWQAEVETPVAGSPHDYYVLRYRARGIERSHSPVTVLAALGSSGDAKTLLPLLTADQVINDDRWHVVVGKKALELPIGALQVQVTTGDRLGRFEVGRLSFHPSLPEIQADLVGNSRSADASNAAFQAIDLGDRCNDSTEQSFRRVLDQYGMVVDGGLKPASETWIPLDFPADAPNLIRPAENPALNTEKVDLLGTQTTRHYFKPKGRDDLITVPIGKRASEVFFIMAAELPPSESCYARPPWPRPVDDIESVAVELQYADGERDFAFPYSLADEGFLVRRAVACYVVPVDPERELARFVLHNRLPGKTFSLGAVTVNTSPARVVPEMLPDGSPVQVPQWPQPAKRSAAVERDGDRIILSNTFFKMVVNCCDGFSLESLHQRYSDTAIRLAPSSGLEVELGDTILTGRAFKTESMRVDAGSATIGLRSLVPAIPIRFTVRISVDDSPQVTMNLTVENAGESPLEPTVRFPVLRAMTIGEGDHTWLFFPQYRNVITNRCGAYIAPNDHCFPMQVCDVYNPRAGVGLALLTHNRDHCSLDYSMAKTERGVSAFVQAPGELYRIEPARSVTFTESCLVFHSGDWHEAIRIYRDWLDAVSESSVAQTKDWFCRSFLLRNHQTRKFYAWSAPIYDPDTRTYCIDDCVATDTDYLRVKPDIFHLFGWIDLENSWQGHPNGDFLADNCTGGVETLKAAVERLQDKHEIPTSLYTLSDRCYKKSEFGKAHGERLAIRRRDGSLVQDEANWHLCGNSQTWRDQYVEGLCRTQRETGVKILYVDVFPFSRGSACYSPDHGHEVPSHVNRGTCAMIRQLRESLPDDVALWSEYPLPDLALPCIDGNIHYYCLDWHEHFGRLYDRLETAPSAAEVPHNLYRFVFPNLKQFIFPCGVSSHSGDTKFPFFGGEALYDCGWSLYAGDHLERIKKSLAIQQQYADCFASPEPVPEVETLQRHVHANCFPGQGRTVWTLFNARYTTVRGAVLAVEHRPGATYTDVWNDVPLDPEIVDGHAVIRLKLDPQHLGCAAQSWKQGQEPPVDAGGR